jgi:hypothetical protein
MFAYLMIYIPCTCRNIAIGSNGSMVCGLSIGANLIAIAEQNADGEVPLLRLMEERDTGKREEGFFREEDRDHPDC